LICIDILSAGGADEQHGAKIANAPACSCDFLTFESSDQSASLPQMVWVLRAMPGLGGAAATS
jgi:hypothetical protein